MHIYNMLFEYQNGNYKVRIYNDGTKIRFTDDDEFVPLFPESIDLKITNRCDLRCSMCHELSSPSGKDADLNHPFLSTLKKGTELAIGGGNPLDHKKLVPFLKRMKKQGVICNITVNQVHLIKEKDLILSLIENKLIHGLGISVTNDLFLDEIIKFAGFYRNSVIHLIAGIIDENTLNKLKDNNLKILFLGYKQIGRGKDYYSFEVEEKIKFIEKNIMDISSSFEIVSFDNLAIKQLKMKEKILDFDEKYMGDDGQFTMYIDLVKEEFSISSTNEIRFKMTQDIESMFNVVRNYQK